ncbi:MAG: hypothetical protein IJM27_11740, partial [Eubacterium sp.]|nr:hypothetical protein [Eubacterium sp.]
DYSNHTMKIFYMERGAGASNLHMRFNLSYVNPGSVVFSKEVTGTSNLDFELVEYPYQIWYKDSQPDPPGQTLNHEHLLTNDYDDINVVYQNSTQKVDYLAQYTPPGSNVVYESVYFLHPGMAAEIFFPDNTIEYKIIECGINHEVYDEVSVNGTTITGTAIGDSGRNSYDSGWLSVIERPRVSFKNHVDPDGLRTLTFRKELKDKDGTILEPDDDPTVYNFRLYLSNGVDDSTLSLAYMAPYYVRDMNGYYCYWDSGSQKFVASEYDSQLDLTILETDSKEVADLKASLVHETSMNGAISKIPAWYTVEVPNIAVGTYFKVVERFSDTDLGYGRIDYEGDLRSFRLDATAQYHNTGWVIAEQTPFIAIRNQRGYSIEAKKVWSDKAYMKSHDPIYLALYLDGEDDPVSGYVRVLNSSDSYVRFFLQDLAPGKTLADYEVYEVELEVENEGDLRIDEDGVVTNYKSVKKVIQNGSTTVNGVAKGSTVPTPYEYSVTYERGPLGMSNPALTEYNTRTDTITNTREGGIAITLYDMNTNLPLADGEFTIKKKVGEGQYDTVGTYQSDAEGRVTILYEFDRDTEYVLTETASPSGYIGLPNPVSFWLDTDGAFHYDGNGNETMWQNGYNSDLSTGDKLVAYLNVYNRPFTIEVYKYDGASNGSSGLQQAHFELFRGVKGFGGTRKDFVPMAGYEDLVTGQNGRITGINHELVPNTYYLTEKTPPEGYQGLDGDVVFKISPLGAMELVSKPEGSGVELVTDEEGAIYKYYLNIPNTRIDDTEAILTVTKTVTGNQGSRDKEFNFTFAVTGDDGTGTTEYAWTKNGISQATPLKSGGTFKLAHNERVAISVPGGAEVTITETPEDYKPTFQLGDAAAEEVSTKRFTVSADITLAVTNTRAGIIPTGVWMNCDALLVMALMLGAGIVFFTRRGRKRRRTDEED